jgi:hypothetical protein
MVQISVSDLQRKMNTVVMPAISSGEEILVFDKKAGIVKFRIIPPTRVSEIEWGDFTDKLMNIESEHHDPTAVALCEVSADRVFK